MAPRTAPPPDRATTARERRNAYRRHRYQTDPAYREKHLRSTQEWRKRNPDHVKTKAAERRANPETYEADKARSRARMKAKRQDPDFHARERARARERYWRKKAARTA